MYLKNPSPKKPIIKFLFVLCFSFLICPAFSQPVSTKLPVPNSKTGNLTNTASKQEGAQAEISSSTKEKTLPSVWKISNSSSSGTTFAISPNQMITNFHVLSEMLKDEGSLKDIVLIQSVVGSSQLKIQQILKVSALYDLVLFETKETVSNYLKLTDNFLDPKEELSIVGYPKGVLKTIQKTGNLFQADSLSSFLVNIIDVGGLSGSPVLNIQGEVVGVACGSISNLLRFTKVSDIQKLLSGKDSTLCSSFPSPIKCFEQEMRNLRQMAEEGSAFAQYRLANIYREGIGTEINRDLAFEWFKKSAEQGFAPAQYVLAVRYLEGIGTEINEDLAFKWYKKSADQGYAPAQYGLAYMYAMGLGKKVNRNLVFELYKKSAEQGYAPAQYSLADTYRQGFGTEINEDLAFKWYKKSADQGYEPAKQVIMKRYSSFYLEVF